LQKGGGLFILVGEIGRGFDGEDTFFVVFEGG
jgi:hypothetical protein